MTVNKNMQFNFIVRKWGVWPPIHPNADNGLEQRELLSSIPGMLKRRLSPLAKTVFCAANQCIQGDQHIHTVFSSTHGELAKSFAMMEMIEAGEEISPTLFSLSVHNAIAGLFSIAYNNQLKTTVVAPGEEGMAAAFIEGLGLLQQGADQVLLILYDEPLLSFYPSAPYRLTTENSTAVALLIAKEGDGQAIKMSQRWMQGDDGEQAVQLPALISLLSSNQRELMVKNARYSWCWQKQ